MRLMTHQHTHTIPSLPPPHADSVWKVMRLMDHDRLLFVASSGQLYSLRGFDIPEAARTSVGTPLADLLPGEGGVRGGIHG